MLIGNPGIYFKNIKINSNKLIFCCRTVSVSHDRHCVKLKIELISSGAPVILLCSCLLENARRLERIVHGHSSADFSICFGSFNFSGFWKTGPEHHRFSTVLNKCEFLLEIMRFLF